MTEVLVLQHDAKEPLGTIAAALNNAGLNPYLVTAYDGSPVPPTLGTAQGLIVLGGPQGVYEQAQYPYLTAELRLIENALRQDKPILGVCLGSQLLAAALGAAVQPSPTQEIGWHQVTLTETAQTDQLWREMPVDFVGFHWHGDSAALPAGAVGLASSALTPNQAFRYGKHAWGLQFHMEVTDTILQDWCAAYGRDLQKATLTEEAILPGIASYLPPMQRMAAEVFGRWAALAAET